MDKFKPGVEGIVLMFSDNEGNNVYEFPYYSLLRDELEPLLLEVCHHKIRTPYAACFPARKHGQHKWFGHWLSRLQMVCNRCELPSVVNSIQVLGRPSKLHGVCHIKYVRAIRDLVDNKTNSACQTMQLA
jgi:hypothetical protein